MEQQNRALNILVGMMIAIFASSCDFDTGTGLQTPPEDFSGIWSVEETITGNCQGSTYPKTDTYVVNVTQSANTFTFSSTSSDSLTHGTITGPTVDWSFSRPDGNGTIRGTFSGTISADGQTVTGSANRTWYSDSMTYECSGVTSATAKRVPTGPGPAGEATVDLTGDGSAFGEMAPG